MSVRLSDLPPAVRARVEAELGQSRHRTKSRAGVGLDVPCPGHCACGVTRWNIDLKALT